MTKFATGKAAMTKTDPNEGQGGLGKATTTKKGANDARRIIWALGEFSSFFSSNFLRLINVLYILMTCFHCIELLVMCRVM